MNRLQAVRSETVREQLGVADTAEGSDRCRRQWTATWKGWGNRETKIELTIPTTGNKKYETRKMMDCACTVFKCWTHFHFIVMQEVEVSSKLVLLSFCVFF